MRLEKFYLENFRSIEEISCDIKQNITILAGKNESGKTNILEGLEKINREVKFENSDIPQDNYNAISSVKLFLRADRNDVQFLIEKLNNCLEDVNEKFAGNFGKFPMNIEIGTFSDKESRYVSGNLLSKYKEHIASLISKQIKDFNLHLINLSRYTKTNLNNLRISNKVIDDSILNQMKQQVSQLNSRPPEEFGDLRNSKEKIITSFNNILNCIVKLRKESDNSGSTLSALIPKIVYFDSFIDILPHNISINDVINENKLKEKRIIWDLVKLSKLDIDSLKTPDIQRRTIAVKNASKVSSELFGKYWNQDPIEIVIDDKKDELCFWVYDQGKEVPFKPEQRSKGFQWYLSFFLRLTSEGLEDNTIILIDEPGAYLHAKAQKEVLELLDYISRKHQIIFSTHSPYLIDPDKLGRIKLVEKIEETKQTILIEKFNKGSDYDTLTPLITAMGFDLLKVLRF